jgi:hypothetical protein
MILSPVVLPSDCCRLLASPVSCDMLLIKKKVSVKWRSNYLVFLKYKYNNNLVFLNIKLYIIVVYINTTEKTILFAA